MGTPPKSLLIIWSNMEKVKITKNEVKISMFKQNLFFKDEGAGSMFYAQGDYGLLRNTGIIKIK